MRGDYKPFLFRETGVVRAIPTCVGTTLGLSALIRLKAGHPHVRGDYMPQ